MDQNDSSESEPEHAMDVDHADEYSIQIVEAAPRDEGVHPLALVAVDVAPPDDLVSVSSASTRSPSPPRDDAHSSKKRTHDTTDDDDDGALCPICLDSWANTGEHRVCALKCGHLFGHKCVARWLASQAKKSCPTCKEKVSRNDIRFIYAKRLVAVDAAELHALQQQLDAAVAEKNRAQNDLAKFAYREYELNLEIAKLKAQLGAGKARQPAAAPPFGPPVRLYMEKSMEACRAGGSRVFDARCELDTLIYSLKSPTPLFVGFGLKKIDVATYRTMAFVPTHSLQIRDICFHPQNNWVLTASMDKTFKVTDNVTNSVTFQFMHQMPLWSCCWDASNSNMLYVGTQSGTVFRYDIRNLSEATASLSIEGDMSPVVSVASIPGTPGAVLPLGGLVSCKLNSLWLYENHYSGFKRHLISLDAPFVSMKYQASMRQLLVSSRPNSRISYSRHTLCTFDQREPDRIDANIVYSFRGGGMQKLLSKSCFLSNNCDYVAAHQENCRSVVLWSINTGEKVCQIPARESVLDLKGLQNRNGNFLVSLTERKLEFFKFL